jgi:hypothetical protein
MPKYQLAALPAGEQQDAHRDQRHNQAGWINATRAVSIAPIIEAKHNRLFDRARIG